MKKTVIIFAIAGIFLAITGCTVVLSDSLEGGDSGDGGLLNPMLDILEKELDDSYQPPAETSILSRTLAGGANSILHVLPPSAVNHVKDRVEETVRNQGLGRSRDISKIAPAIAEATVGALLDQELVGEDLTEDELVNIHSVSLRAVVKSMNAPEVTALAEGLGTAEEKTEQLEALIEQAGDSLESFGFSSDATADALQQLVLIVSEEGNIDLEDLDSADASPTYTERMELLLRMAAEQMDDPDLFTGSDCSQALNRLINAAVYGLGGTSLADAEAGDLQSVIRDGVLTGLFLAFYGYEQNVGLSTADLQAALNLTEVLTALVSGAYFDSIAEDIQAVLESELIPEAVATAREAYIINSPTGVSGNVTANAVPAETVDAATTTTWTAGSEIYVSSSIWVYGNLIIEEGAIVYIAIGANITVINTGSITAVGTVSSPVVFTRASSGAWGSIKVESGGNTFEYCDISGGEKGIEITGRADISDCLVHGHQLNALDCDSATADIDVITTVRDSWFYGNGNYPVLINEFVDFDDSNYFHDPETDTSVNLTLPRQAVHFYGGAATPVTFYDLEVPYVVSESVFIIEAPGYLIVEPGAIVKFLQDTYLIRVKSYMTAVGTETEPIVFTSYSNSDIGGDTSGLGGSGSPGDWTGIDVIGADSQFEWCEFSFAERALDFNDSSVDQGSAAVDQCLFHNNSENGIDGSEASEGTAVTNCHIWDCGSWPVILNEYVDFGTTNHFYAPEETEPDPDVMYNAVKFYGDINTPVSFTVSDVPYYISEDPWYIYGTGYLTVSPGVIVKFDQDTYLNRVHSRIEANGTEADPIIFTSYTDSSIGGDTNGSNTPGAPGDWQGMDILGAGSNFQWCFFTYAERAVDFNDSEDDQGIASFWNCRFSHCENNGINGVEAGEGCTVTNSYFWDSGSWPVIRNEFLECGSTNHFYDPDTQSQPDYDAVQNAVYFFGAIDNAAVVFDITEVPYYVEEDPWYIQGTGNLTVSPGTVLKLKMDTNAIRVKTYINAEGTSEARITFTSYNNSDILGDTSGQGVSGAPGDWYGLDIQGADTVLEYCDINLASIPIDFNQSTDLAGAAVIDNCNIQNNENGGIDATEAFPGTVISNCVINGNNATASGPYDIDISGNGNVVYDTNNTYDHINE